MTQTIIQLLLDHFREREIGFCQRLLHENHVRSKNKSIVLSTYNAPPRGSLQGVMVIRP